MQRARSLFWALRGTVLQETRWTSCTAGDGSFLLGAGHCEEHRGSRYTAVTPRGADISL